ncbi:MAG: cytochrome P450 [Boseongicola sp. SB0667_bin_21]|nr:cytochrome P450 [Boseongicola sp. SB0667_bin_21]
MGARAFLRAQEVSRTRRYMSREPSRQLEFPGGCSHARVGLPGQCSVARTAQEDNCTVIEFKACLRDLIRHRRSFPDESSPTEVLIVLADAEADAERLTELELLHQCIFMLIAGHETSTNMLTHGVHEILRSPWEIRCSAENPGLVDSMVEEALRCRAPIQINNRGSTEDSELGGLATPEGTVVHLVVVAANHDSRQFPDPDRFDMARRPNRPLSFRPGIHLCAGNSLARMDAAIAFRKLFGRFPGDAASGAARNRRTPAIQ